MVGSFPDDQSVFHPMAHNVASLPEIRAVGVICMPGYNVLGRPDRRSADEEEDERRDVHPRNGYTFEECATV